RKAESFHVEGVIACPKCFAGLQDAFKKSLQPGFPEFTPHLSSGLSQGGGMFFPEHWTVGVVVQGHQVRTPKHRDLSFGRKKDADCAAKTLRPRFKRPELSCGPVKGA